MERAEQSYQLALNINSSETSSLNAKDIFVTGYNQNIRDLVESRKLWNEKPKGLSLFLFLDNPGEVVKFNPENFEYVDRTFTASITPRSKFSSLVIVAENNPSSNNADALKEKLPKLVKSLVKHAPAFFYTQKLLDNQDKIINIFKESGLRKVHYLKSLNLVESRTEKKREPINIVSPDRPKLLRLAKEKWKIMRKVYFDEGFMILDPKNSEIVSRLKESYNPREDLSRLVEGYGVNLMARCGCKWKVNLKGDWTRSEYCADEECDGYPYVEPIYKDGKKIVTKHICFDCCSNLEKVYRVSKNDKRLPGRRTLLEYELRCPSCGLVELTKEPVSNCLISY